MMKVKVPKINLISINGKYYKISTQIILFIKLISTKTRPLKYITETTLSYNLNKFGHPKFLEQSN